MHWLCRARLSKAALLIGIVGLLAGHGFAATAPSPTRVSVCFSPDGGCTDVVVRELDAAQKRVLVQAYSFTSAPIAKALTDAHKRGVKILAVLDKSNETDRYSAATFLTNAGIPTLIDDKHAIAHSKVMVIDDTTVITGSFNFTKAAEEKNAENLVVLKDAPDLVKAYEQNINELPLIRILTAQAGDLPFPLVDLRTLGPEERFTGTRTAKFTTCQGAQGMTASALIAWLRLEMRGKRSG